MIFKYQYIFYINMILVYLIHLQWHKPLMLTYNALIDGFRSF